MYLREVTTKEQWDEQIGSTDQAQFLQSWAWGEFQRGLGRKVWLLDLDGDFVLVVRMSLPLDKNYLYIPRTKVKFNEEKIKALKELALTEGSLFIRIEPITQNLEEFNFNKVKPVQPQNTLLLDLSQTEEELLKNMHSKTRYNIRLAEKKGVKVEEAGLDKLDIFYNLLQNTYQRKAIKTYAKKYFEDLIKSLPKTKIYLAKYEDKILAANLVVFYEDTATYVHGGTSDLHRNLMAPYLLQWEVIKKAKALGLHYYDFWGIEDRYPGVARFKNGFSGFTVDFPGAYDLVIDKYWYFIYKLVKKIRK